MTGAVFPRGRSALPAQRACFPKRARLRVRGQFAQVFEHGKRVALPALALHWLPGGEGARLGLAVSRKVDRRAVGRNRIRRVLRESFRLWREQIAAGEYVLVARGGAAQLDGDGLRRCLLQLLQKARALPAPFPPGTMPADPIDPSRA